jgi:glucose-6-phosphate 1-dehydrogenase
MSSCFEFVLFGAAGDLALRKLLCALYRIVRDGETIPSRIVACVRTPEQEAGYHAMAREALERNLHKDEFVEGQWQQMQALLRVIAIDIRSCDDCWQRLAQLLQGERPPCARVIYLAIAPSIYGECCDHLARSGLIDSSTRVVLEKPIGYDRATAQNINAQVARHFSEDQIFRIDHYLGKETVQNLLALRFSNILFEQMWDSKSIDHVQISISEIVGIEGRGGFYDNTGALRDMVQNHLLQLLCLVAMESPHRLDARNIRIEKLKVLESLRPLTGDDVRRSTVRGQYAFGEIGEATVPGYLEESGAPKSTTETFVALQVYIDNWRWAHVPFYLRTGKRLKARMAEIVVQFKPVSHRVYATDVGALTPNRLVIRLQPDESLQLTLMAKDLTRNELSLTPVTLNLNFNENGKLFRSDAYRRLLLDVVHNNHALFLHRDEVDAAWQWIDPIIAAWQASQRRPHLYRAGSWGPEEADQLIAQYGRAWYNGGEVAAEEVRASQQHHNDDSTDMK